MIGDQLAKLAIAILIYHRTHSALLSSLTFAVAFLPALVAGPAAGVLIDRYPRRRILLVCDGLRVPLVAIMCVPRCPTWALLVVMLLVASLESPFASARSAMLPDLMSPEAYPTAQSYSSLTDQVGQVVGFGLGGLLVGMLSARGALALDAASFALSAALIAALVRARPPAVSVRKGSYWRDSSEGARIVFSTPLLRRLLILEAVGPSLLIATEGLAVAYAASMHGGDFATGVLAASSPIGIAIGIGAVTRFVPPPRRLDALRTMAVFWPLPLIATVLHPSVPVTCVLWVISSALISYTVLGSILFVEALTAEIRGRALAFFRAVLIAGQGLGALVCGAIAERLGAADTVALAGVTGLAICPFLAQALRSPARHLDGRASSHSIFGRKNGMSAPNAEAPAPSARPRLPSGKKAPADSVARGRRWSAIFASLSVILLGALLVTLNVVPDTTALRPVHAPWWLLTAAFLAVDVFHVPFQRGRTVTMVCLSEIPLVMGLFLSSPVEIFWGATIAFVIRVFWRSLNLEMSLANVASGTILTVGASAVFGALRPGEGRGWWDLLAALASVVTVDVLTYFFVIFGIYDLLKKNQGSRAERLRPLWFTLLTGTVGASVGLLAVAAMWAKASYGLLLVLIGFMIIIGSRAYADLQERHNDLRQLYTFQGQLKPLTPRLDDLREVLDATRELLTATSVEISILPDPTSGERNGPRHVLTSHVDHPASEEWHSEPLEPEPDASKRISVQLSRSGRVLGTLSAFERLGSTRGFRRADLQLLETLGVHVSDALEKGELLDQLRDAASHDGLTGLFTLAELSLELDQDLMRQEPAVVALLDVARLKDVNDSLGHEAGDALLKVVAERIVQTAPAGSLLARSGGGEFAIAVPNLSGEKGPALVERLAEMVGGLVQVLDVTIDLRVRVGWAHGPTDGPDAATLIRRADLALASAKRGLRRTAAYAPELEIDGMRRIRLVNDLRDAIDMAEIEVVYQPLVTSADGRVVGAEALARWTHREFGPLPPDEFIILAEQSGLIGQLTELVLDKALAQTALWAEAGHALRIAVNLSARCLSDLGIPDVICALLEKHRVASSMITLEVTETSVAEDPAHAELVLHRLRDLGIRLSIDDFGTGYSSLASLKRFPVHEVKLDRQFVIDLENGMLEHTPNPQSSEHTVDEALVVAIVALGHSLDLEIVAEGVETASAYLKLRELGVDVLQGYFIGRPMTGTALQECAVNPIVPLLSGTRVGRKKIHRAAQGSA